MVVTTYRSDELNRRHPLRPLLAELERSPCARRIELERFDRDEVADQLADIIGAAPDADVVERMYGAQRGQSPVHRGAARRGRRRAAPLPPSLREALLLRVERLPAETQRLLRLLAVARRRRARAARRGGGRRRRRALAPRSARRSRRRSSWSTAPGGYGFRHALLREVVYDDLLPGERSELHLALRPRARAGRAPRATGRGRPPGSPITTTRRATSRGRWSRRSRRPARSQRLHAYGEAAGLLDRALELWNRVPDPEEHAGADHAEILARAGRAHYLAGDEEMGAALYEPAIAEIDEEAEPERAAKVLTGSRPASGRSAGPSAAGPLSAARSSCSARTRRSAPSCSPSGSASCSSRGASATSATRRPRRSRPASAPGSSRDAGVGQPPRLRAVRARRGRGGARRGWTSRSSSPSAPGPATTSPPRTSTTPTPSTSPGAATRRARSAERGLAEVEHARRLGADALDALDPAQHRRDRVRPRRLGAGRGRSSAAGAVIAASRSPTRTCAGLSSRSAAASTTSPAQAARPGRRAARDALEPQYIALLGVAARPSSSAAAATSTRRAPRSTEASTASSSAARTASGSRSSPAPALHDRGRRRRARPRPRRRGGRARRAVRPGGVPARAASEPPPRTATGPWSAPWRRPPRRSWPGPTARTTRSSGPRPPTPGTRRAALPRGPRPLAPGAGRARARGDRAAAAATLADAIAAADELGAAWLSRRGRGLRRPRPAHDCGSPPRPTATAREPAAEQPVRAHPARAPGARAARHGGHEPRDRRAALHGGEDRQRPRLADPHQARRSRPDRGRRGRPPPRARGRALARRRLSGCRLRPRGAARARNRRPGSPSPRAAPAIAAAA